MSSVFVCWHMSTNIRNTVELGDQLGGGSPIPKSICQNSYQKVNILMKTKNAPKDLKCKINHTFFLETGVPKRVGGGVRHLGNIPKKSRFFLGWRPLSFICISWPFSFVPCYMLCFALIINAMGYISATTTSRARDGANDNDSQYDRWQKQ